MYSAASSKQGYKGYAIGDFPYAEQAAEQTLFLPELTDPIPGAAELVLTALVEAARG